MSDNEGSKKPKEGLTKPLVNNVGGVIDQDAPAADQIMKGERDPAWGSTSLEQGGAGVHHEDRSGFMPDAGGRPGQPLDDAGLPRRV